MKRSLIFITLIILAVAIDSAAQQSPGRAKAITGRVVSDSGQPVANATIYLNKVGVRQGPGVSTSTDEQGGFRTDDLDNGAYWVNAMVPGFVSTNETAEPQFNRPGDSITFHMTKGGVITGAVTTSVGEPVVAARVRAIKVREIDGRPPRRGANIQERATDDRGIYRLYGLQSGVYVVAVTGRTMFGFAAPSLYEGDAPTYYPSSTRDAAAEVTVRAGDEASGIDIRYRGDRGHAVSGTVAGSVEGNQQMAGVSVWLAHASNGVTEAQEFIPVRGNNRSFALYGVPDGEYEITARRGAQADGASSVPRRVTVKGADVTGLELVLAPNSSIAGNVIMEPLKESERKPECGDKRQVMIEEIVVTARRDDKDSKERARPFSRSDSTPNSKGEFAIFNLRAGLFRINTGFPGEGWYVRSMNLLAAASAGKPKVVARDAARLGLQLNQGERLTGLTITIAEGAASIAGKVLPAKEGERLASQVRIHLAPAEPESKDDALRYREVMADADGDFAIASLAPGRYFILAREVAETSAAEDEPRPAGWDEATRAAIRREAEAVNQTIELQPCKRVADYSVRVAAAKPAAKKQ
ncbi:MAG TPA: carboxypeptidase regulatory-like domain-containing protein [Blastocatellia bacterium]|nr:carboxypeptidase regulatory-like domain-containing protein [Blastocatellia bacterium]